MTGMESGSSVVWLSGSWAVTRACDPRWVRDRQHDEAILWPAGLRRPTSGALLVYLDLNHWIGLAKAAVAHPQGVDLVGCLDGCVDAVHAGRAVFPLSGTHYMELAKINDPRQRNDIADVMETLSGFVTLLSRPVVMRLEVETAFAALLGQSLVPYMPLDLLGHGFGPAFGRDGSLRVREGNGADITASLGPDALAGLAAADRWAQRQILAGPADADIPALEQLGYDPATAGRLTENRARQERELAGRLDAEPRWRRGRLRDVISGWEMTVELLDMVTDELTRRSLTLPDVHLDRQSARRLVRSMPSTDVSVELKTAMHRNSQRAIRWSSNDVMDIDALSLAVPYCNVVVTEKAAHHTLTTADSGSRYGTRLLRDLPSLTDLLSSA